ncbi:MAG: RNA polymerase sigma factor [Deltaproteobacteria bacterium]
METLLLMVGTVSLNPQLVAEVEKMLGDGYVEGLVRRLCRDFPSLAGDATGAVGHAVEKLVVRPVPPDKPRSYLAACAYNEMKRVRRTRARVDSLDALADENEDGRTGWTPSDPGLTVEEQVLLTETYDQLRSHVETWETDNVRIVTLLYLEAAFECEPLTSADAAELVGELLSYEVEDSFVRTWKSRGFKKLRDYVAALDAVETREERTLP